MISQRQSMSYNIGGQNASDNPVASLSYVPISNSPQLLSENQSVIPKPADAAIQGTKSHIFIPQKDDVVKQRFRLRYSPCSDAYYREWEDCIVSRVGGNIHGLERGVYSFDSVERIVDSQNNRVYIERTAGTTTGIITWKMDFWPSGLVIDQVSMKVTSCNINGGEVLAMLSSNEKRKTISNIDGLGSVKMKDFENSKHLILSVHLIGETADQETRLFEQDLMNRAVYPLDIKITLKPPPETYNKPVILLGVMFSNSQETTVDRRHYRTHSCSSGGGYLHLNIVQGKNISGSKDTPPDSQVKCYLLPDDKNTKSCKTGRSKKSSTPVWDEYFVIDGINRVQLRKKKLKIRVIDWQLGMSKKNTRLGEVKIGCTGMFDSHSFPSPRSLTQETKNGERKAYRAVEEADEVFTFPPSQNEYVCDESGKESMNDRDVNMNQQNHNTGHGTGVKASTATNDDVNGGGKECNTKKPLKSLAAPSTDHEANKSPDSPNRKVKPKRPPPPSAIKLKEACTNSRQVSVASEDSPGKVTTPTFSRLAGKSPRARSRRSSWGGESDLSLQSPRGALSPGVYAGTESCQWDFMVCRPKEWVYSWQVLDVDSTE